LICSTSGCSSTGACWSSCWRWPCCKLGDLLPRALQWAQCQSHGIALQQQQGEQGETDQAQTAQPHARKAVENRCVVLRHADNDRLSVAAVLGAIAEQSLALWTVEQFVRQARAFRPFWRGVPQRAGTPGALGQFDLEVVAGERPLIARVEALHVQLIAVRPLHQGNQQALGFLAQIGFQTAPEA